MRLWSLHPGHLDRQGLTACWREGLLAQAVLAGRTRGYTRHPQLDRFRALGDPVGGIGTYLAGIAEEALRRGYRFDESKIVRRDPSAFLTVTTGQLDLEWGLLLAKLAGRSPEVRAAQAGQTRLTHPMMREVAGPVEPWERQTFRGDGSAVRGDGSAVQGDGSPGAGTDPSRPGAAHTSPRRRPIGRAAP